MWETAPGGVALSESAFSASPTRVGSAWLVNLTSRRKSVGAIEMKVNPMRDRLAAESSGSGSSGDSDSSDSANGEDAPSEDTPDDALREGWTKRATEDGRDYFTNNHHPEDSTWMKPTLPACPPGYVAKLAASTGKVYFLHVADGTTSWDHPAATMGQINASGSV